MAQSRRKAFPLEEQHEGGSRPDSECPGARGRTELGKKAGDTLSGGRSLESNSLAFVLLSIIYY